MRARISMSSSGALASIAGSLAQCVAKLLGLLLVLMR